MQPAVIASGLKFTNMDSLSRLGFESGSWLQSNGASVMSCPDVPCPGFNMMLLHDTDGSLGTQGKAGQLVYNNPEYVGPYPFCYEAVEVHPGLFFCPYNSDPTKEIKQYNALWRDWGPQIIQPIIIKRRVNGDTRNRTFASYGPKDDECAKRMYFSRFPLLIVNGSTHFMSSTGTVPDEFMVRWDAPSGSVAVLKFFIQSSYDINVFVSDQPDTDFEYVPRLFNRYPNMYDPAGSNTRDPQRRVLAVTIRGGTNRFYRFRTIPAVAVTMRLDMPFSTFVGDSFIANMALLLGIYGSSIKIVSVKPGSAIVHYLTNPNTTVATNKTQVQWQVDEVNTISSNLNYFVGSGDVSNALNVPLLNYNTYFKEPSILHPFDPTIDYGTNGSNGINMTAIRISLIQQDKGVFISLYPDPSNLPTSHPSRSPSSQPTRQPFKKPSSQPSRLPSSQPTKQPVRNPSVQPLRVPSSQPSRQPLRSPSSQPSRQPLRQPSSQPSRLPSAQPTSKPSLASKKPSFSPTKRPIYRPTPLPTNSPSFKPSNRPTNGPTYLPTVPPSNKPTTNPTFSPTYLPSASPSNKPTTNPTFFPTTSPTKSPSVRPTQSPTTNPSAKPSREPSNLPSVSSTIRKTSTPSSLPSFRTTQNPTKNLTSKPSFVSTIRPTTQAPSKKSTQNPTSKSTTAKIVKKL